VSIDLRYGTNPHQQADAVALDPDHPPLRVLSGTPSYVNLLDALASWQLVREADRSASSPAHTCVPATRTRSRPTATSPQCRVRSTPNWPTC
jgi:AICAR transformylase/IMP cyclohydrolase PurH